MSQDKIKLFNAVDFKNDFQLDLPKFHGRYDAQLIRGGKVIDAWGFDNLIVNAGLNDILNKYFLNGTTPAQWYLGLIDNTSFSVIADGDTMASHTGWLELDTNSNTVYSNTTRLAWTPASSTAESLTNGTAVTFNFIASAAVNGAFLITDSTKGGTTGTLWSAASFGAVRNVLNGDTLNLTYTLND